MRSWSGTRPSWPGWSTSAASTSTRTRCGPTTSTIPTSCGSTWTRCRGCRGRTSSRWPWWPGTPWRTSGSSAGPRPPGRAASTSTAGSSRAGPSPRSGGPRSPWPGRSSGAPPRSPPAGGGRRSATGCSWTTTRTPRTGPLPPPIRSARPPTSGSMPLRWEQVPDCRPEAFTIDTVPGIVAETGDAGEGIDDQAGSLTALLELADQHEEAGFADAPWPPHFVKAEGEPSRAQPSKRRQPGPPVREGFVPPPAPGKTAGPTGRRRTTMPLIEVARAATEAEAREGLERWKARHPGVWPLLGPTDLLVDAMRGRSTVWYRIRLNLRNVPEGDRPPQEALEVDYDPWSGRPPGPSR